MPNSGFLKYDRRENEPLPELERLKNFDEFKQPLSHEQRIEQAARCMHCGVPFCQSALELKGMVTGCPLHNLVPEWNQEIFSGNDEYALRRLLKTNPFPEFTSRVCPAPCEKACLNGVDSEPTSIHDNEFYIIENGFEKGWMEPSIPAFRSDKRVAVIGSGPAGLSAAHMLNQRGHHVTVFEKADAPGGLLMYGIPNMKLDKEIMDRRIDLMKKEGVEFVCSTNVGVDITKEQLMENYDAIVLAAGAKKARDLHVENRELPGVYFAVDYLSMATRSLITGKKPPVTAKGKHVVIVGGGDTGNDCVGTALRQHAKSVVQLEMMPEPPVERAADNPWPEWPKVKKTDYGQEEAIAVFGKDPRIFKTTVTRLLEHGGKLHDIEIAEVGPDFRPVPGTERTIRCDLLLIAAGFVGVEDYIKDHFELPVTNRNTIITRPNSYQTDKENIFACGDCKRGQSLVVWAIAQGKDCAKEVDHYLMGYSNIE